LGSGHLPQSGYGLFGPRLLHVAHDGIEHNDRQNCDRFIGQCRVTFEQP
jgi:hypothetical protein